MPAALNPAYACYAVLHHVPAPLQSTDALASFLTAELPAGSRCKVARWHDDDVAILHFGSAAAAALACSTLDGTRRLDEAFRRVHEEEHPLGPLPPGSAAAGGGGGGGGGAPASRPLKDATVANRLIRGALGPQRHKLGGERTDPASTGSGYLRPNAPLPSRADSAWQRVGGGGGGGCGGGDGAAAGGGGGAAAGEEPRACVRGRGVPLASEERTWWRGGQQREGRAGGGGAEEEGVGEGAAGTEEGRGGKGAGAVPEAARGGVDKQQGQPAVKHAEPLNPEEEVERRGGGAGAQPAVGVRAPPQRRPLLAPTAAVFVPGSSSRLAASSAEWTPSAALEVESPPQVPPPPPLPPPPPPPPAASKPRGRGSATFGGGHRS
jgi:hypothetical protein